MVTGRAEFTMDTEIEGMLHLKVLHSPHAHARIVSIDKTAALAVPGVHRVYTWEDVPRKRFTTAIHTDHLVDPDDTYILDNVVRFAGQRVVAVLADTVGAAEEGCRQVVVEYEVLPAVFDPEEAMADGAPQLHGYDDPFVHDQVHNILLELHGEIGDVEAGFAEADVIHEGTYFSPRVQHAHLETHGSIAWMEDGRLHVRTSSQSPSIAKVKLAHLFGLRPDQLRVFCKRVGGGFGGKQEVISEDLVALATLDTGRPVCLEYTREEEFTTASPRHPMKITVKLGAKADGTLTAFQFRNVSNTGAYGNHGGETLFAGGAAMMQYRCPNKKFDAYSVYTNTVPSGALRGYGMTQPAFAVESAMHELAIALDIDPLELRRRNIVRPGDALVAIDDAPDDVVFTEDGLPQCIDLVDDALRRDVNGHALGDDWLVGTGTASSLHETAPPDRAHLRGLGHPRRRRHLRNRRRHRRIRRGHVDRACADRGEPPRHHAVAGAPGAVRHRPDGLRHRRVRQRGPVRRGQRRAAGVDRPARPHPALRRRAHRSRRRDLRDGRRRRALRRHTRVADRAARGRAARGIRFTDARKAYGSPRSVTSNTHGFRIAVHRVTGEIRILLQRPGHRRRRDHQPGAGARPDRGRRRPGHRLRADRELPRRRRTA